MTEMMLKKKREKQTFALYSSVATFNQSTISLFACRVATEQSEMSTVRAMWSAGEQLIGRC